MPADRGHPPAPGPVVRPNLHEVLNAVRDVTFPISKKELVQEINEEDSVVLNGRNVDLRTLVRDLNDDYFDSEDEFTAALEDAYGAVDDAELIVHPMPPTGFPEEMPEHAQGRWDQPGLPEDNA